MEAQRSAAMKWKQVLLSTKITLPTAADRVPVAVKMSTFEVPPICDTFPSAPGMDRHNIDDQYTPEYIEQLKTELTPLVEQSNAYIQTYGFRVRDFLEAGVEYDPATIVEVALAVQGLTEDGTLDPALFGVEAQQGFWDDAESCLKEVFEWDMFTALLNGQTGGLAKSFDRATRKALIKLVGKVATRALGWVGAAITVYEFTNCMLAVDYRNDYQYLTPYSSWKHMAFRRELFC